MIGTSGNFLYLAMLLSFLSFSCKDSNTSGEESGSGASSVEKTKGPNARVVCQRPSGISKDPRSNEELIALINAMPKPLSVSCLLDVLERPFYLTATKNQFSGHPAYNADSPRILLYLGKKLILSVVPRGGSSKIIEMGDVISSTHSVKGELVFPVTEQLSADAAYKDILTGDKKNTVCTGCHGTNVAAGAGFADYAFANPILPLSKVDQVPLADLQKKSVACETLDAPECEMIQSIFFRGEVYEGVYP